MRLTRHFGFYWWGQCPNFKLEDHVYETEMESGDLDEKGLHKFHDSFTKRGWKEGKPLWEIVLLPQYKGGCAFGLRLHHSLADGFGLYNLLNAISENMREVRLSPKSSTKYKIRPKEWVKEWVSLLSDFFWLTPSVVYNTLYDLDFNPWIKGEEFRSGENYNYAAPIELSLMKGVAKRLGVSMSELVIAGTSGALREAFLREGDVVPRKASALYPLPALTHSGGLTNDL